jgi:hypothetical protein
LLCPLFFWDAEPGLPVLEWGKSRAVGGHRPLGWAVEGEYCDKKDRE